tara:strand:- start:1942 stop:2628 length:687 start_codon:yes stop_codon:yes gene_type:complete
VINFSKGIDYLEPYPHIVVENCFEEDVLQNLIDEFPDFGKYGVDYDSRNRKKIIINRNISDNFLKSAPTWKSFIDWFESDDVFQYIKNKYKDELNKWDSVVNENSSLNDGFYFDMDWSVATEGYSTPIHRDTDKRVFNFIIFLSDKNWDGGDFTLHSSDGLNNFPINYDNLPIAKSVEAKTNKGLFFLSVPNSYHSVSKMINVNSNRKFIYGAISYRHGDVFRRRNVK